MDDAQLSRRKLLGVTTGAGLALVGGVALRGGQSALAQDTVAVDATPVPLGDPIPDEFTVETNWPNEGGDLSATRDAKGSGISTETVATLGDAWAFPVTSAATFGNLTANPTVAGDVVYVQDAAANVYALNKETGEQLWATVYDDIVPSGGPNGTANAYGMVFTTVGGVGDVVALDAATGAEVWKTNIQGPLKEGITTSPLVHDSVVFVSTIPGSSEAFYGGGQRGLIHALDAATGVVLWYFDTTTDNLWGNPTVNSGGGFWHPPSVDADGKIYAPIANPAPYPGAEGFPWGSSRPGDNLYTNSVLKMDPKTAVLDWYTQVKPSDPFDLDNHLTPILADIDGRELAIGSGKHGFVYALDRATGEIVWRVPVGTHQNDEMTVADLEGTPVDEEIQVFPGTLGGVETPMAYSAAANLVIVPVYELASTYIGTGFSPDAPFDFTTATGLFVALNATDGSTVWQVELPTGPLAGATIANDVVFSSGLDGVILGYNVADGSEVFRYQATAGINTSPAISGDAIFFPAGGPLIPSSNTASPPPAVLQQVIALKLGGTVQAPSAGAAAGTPSADDVEGNPTVTLDNTGNDPGTPETTPGA